MAMRVGLMQLETGLSACAAATAGEVAVQILEAAMRAVHASRTWASLTPVAFALPSTEASAE